MKLIRKEIITLPSEENKIEHIVRYMPWFTNRICINVLYGDIDILHSHPWNFFSFILWGGYYETLVEETGVTTHTRKPGFFCFRTMNQYHIIKPIKKYAVTLFVRGKIESYTKFLVNGKEMRDSKFWLSQGYSKQEIFDSAKIL
jgi:hypothetical protein